MTTEAEARAYVETYGDHYTRGTLGAIDYLKAMLKVIDELRGMIERHDAQVLLEQNGIQAGAALLDAYRETMAKLLEEIHGWGAQLFEFILRSHQQYGDERVAAAIEEAAVWHDAQGAAWQDQAAMAYRQAQHSDEAGASEYRAQHETYTKYRIIHQQSAAHFRAFAKREET